MFSQQIKPGTTSPGPPQLNKNIIEIEFEGDGPLGIRFVKEDNKAVVSGIVPNTVACEYFDLEENMKIVGIETYDCKYISYKDIMDLIVSRWKIHSKIKITFEKTPEDLCLDNSCPVYNFLRENNCEKYYYKFKNLGANCISDFDFIEYSDLTSMNIPEDLCKILYENIKKISQVFSDADDV